jgi:hypothetical protein
MKELFKKHFWAILIMFAAVGLAGSAAYFSISGLSKLFAGSSIQVIIMASFIEFGKLVTTAALHRFWKTTKWWMKYTLTAMVLSVMLITSSGIYGFLADAYSKTSTELDKIDGKIELIEKQKEQKRLQIKGIEELRSSKSGRINSLISLRTQQEARVDSLYNRGVYNAVKKAQTMIDQSTTEIQGLQSELDSIANKISRINEEIGQLDIEILDLQNTDVATEIGPLKYMSTVLNRPMEDIINWFILMLIFVFDPLAVLLVIFASNVYDAVNEGDEKKRSEEPIEPAEEPSSNQDLIESKANDELSEDIDNVTEEGAEDNQKKIIDAINNSDNEIFDYSYDFIPDETGEEVAEYIEGDSGNFERVDHKEEVDNKPSIISGIDSNPLYLKLLDVFFLDGQRKVGDIIPPYDVFVKDIKNRGIECEEKIVKNFLTISNLFGIVNMVDKNKVTIMKDYTSSRQIISLVSK